METNENIAICRHDGNKAGEVFLLVHPVEKLDREPNQIVNM